MNCRPDDVEELLTLAQECVLAGRRSEAVSFLRRAAQSAPLRQDIKDLLAAALEGRDDVWHDPIAGRDLRGDRIRNSFPEEAFPQSPEAVRCVEVPITAFGAGLARAREPDFTACAPPRAEVSEEPVSPFSRSRREPSMRREGGNWRRWRSGISNWINSLEFSFGTAESESEIDEPARPVRRPRRQEAAAGSHILYSAEKDAAILKPRPAEKPIVPDSQKQSAALAQAGSTNFESAGSTVADWLKQLEVRVSGVQAHVALYSIMFLFLSIASGFTYGKFFRAEQISGRVADANGPAVGNSENAAKLDLSQTEQEIVRLATDYLDSSKYKEAIALLTRAIEDGEDGSKSKALVGHLASAYDRMGTNLLEKNQLEESLEYYKKAVDLDPSRSDFALHLGNAYWYCGTLLEKQNSQSYLQKARDVLSETIKMDQNNISAYQRLATVYESLHQTAQAKQAYGEIIKIAPSSTEAEMAGERLKMLSMAN